MFLATSLAAMAAVYFLVPRLHGEFYVWDILLGWCLAAGFALAAESIAVLLERSRAERVVNYFLILTAAKILLLGTALWLAMRISLNPMSFFLGVIIAYFIFMSYHVGTLYRKN